MCERLRCAGCRQPADYAQARVWATAQDGTQVPISLVWKRAFGESGAAPRALHLYGYGSYETSIEPRLSVARLSELDRGVVFAVAHVRGGGEMGRQWYADGKPLHKRNTFTDFVDAAAHLVAEGYTVPERMVAEGGSAGGLLMGAVAKLAAELLAGILTEVPFNDALTSILDEDLPPARSSSGASGRPAARPRRGRVREVVRALRERPRSRVPAHPRGHLAQRHACCTSNRQSGSLACARLVRTPS